MDYDYSENIVSAEIDEDKENLVAEMQSDVIEEIDPFVEQTTVQPEEKNISLKEEFDLIHEIPIDVVKSEVVSTFFFQFHP